MFHPSAVRVFNLTTDILFGRDDLLQGTPEGAHCVAGLKIALIVREGEGTLTAGHAIGKVLHVKALQTVQFTRIAYMGHGQRPRCCPHPTS